MNRLLCVIGLHRWIYGDFSGGILIRTCVRCFKRARHEEKYDYCDRRWHNEN